MATPSSLVFVFPVYEDWKSLAVVMAELAALRPANVTRLAAVVVNDGGSSETDEVIGGSGWDEVTRVDLKINLGHQRAIAVGLSEALRDGKATHVLVMDADGEDRPADAYALLDRSGVDKDAIVVARRTRRSEGLVFRLFYAIYRALFRTLTGQVIDFGNFSVVPVRRIARLTSMAEIWSNYPATILRSRIPVQRVDTPRGERHFGKSRMNFAGLTLHGLSAVSVFAEICLIRSVIFSLSVFAVIVLGVLAVVYMRVFTDLAIPGWSTTVLGFLLVIGFQAVLLPAMAMLLVLFNRSLMVAMPDDLSTRFIAARTKLPARVATP